MNQKSFDEQITPFFWTEFEGNFSFCLSVGDYKTEVFLERTEEGFEGNGYDWTSLAKVFIEEKAYDLKDDIKFDPEAGMFCAYSSNKEALKKFALFFKDTCENELLINDLFSRAELD